MEDIEGGAAEETPAEQAEGGVFSHVLDVVRGEPTLSLQDVATRANLPLQILREIFEASQWADQPAYDERDVDYACSVALLLDHYPLRSVIRNVRTRYRAMTSIVISDLGSVRDRVVLPALAEGADVQDMAGRLGRTAEELLPATTEQLAEDYRHVLVRLLDSAAVARGVALEGGRQIDLAVGFVDVVGYTALSGHIDPAGLDHVLAGFEDLVTTTVAAAEDVLLAKFIGDAAMLVGPEASCVIDVLIELVSNRARLAEAPRRAGMAFGKVLVREGDYYGPVPNLAARLTDHARAWTVLADEELAEELEGRYDVEQISKIDIHGVGSRRPLRVERRDEQDG